MRPLFTLFFLIAVITASAQEQTLPLSLSLFNNGTSLPGKGYAGVFSKSIHPGICLGTAHRYRQGQRSELFQTLKLGYFYHRYNQHGLQLYSEFGYRYRITGGFYAEGLLGAGYLHSFADVQQFRLEDGRYVKKKNWGRPQLMATASLALGYDLQSCSTLPLKLFLQYQFWLQTPFVNKYVPLLPNTALHLGAIYSLKRPRHNNHPGS
ncbi:hypothetical protein [Taibaiella koreensis]|uniref:hypothetical protein n=1 Tax=Taibaiella koreensis TaxID=1268548 RepID=UPI0013C2DB70|nr:hypothetical protein [Taibaiella koreensis]